MNCGSNDLSTFGAITSLKPRAGNMNAYPQRYRCDSCGFFGVPVFFDSEEERLHFAELKKSKNDNSLLEYKASSKDKYGKVMGYVYVFSGLIFFAAGFFSLLGREAIIGFGLYAASLLFLGVGISTLRNKK